jgi:hypothetical protein
MPGGVGGARASLASTRFEGAGGCNALGHPSAPSMTSSSGVRVPFGGLMAPTTSQWHLMVVAILTPLYAHRLGREPGPDSSRASLRATLAGPVDGLEADACLTADGRLACCTTRG